ncbi:hypothetical protein J7L67_05765, partial [bacterium]|nr:hypothetical protein [bacterium]
MDYNIALIFDNLRELQNSRLNSSKATINELVATFINGALLQKKLMNEALKKQYFDVLINALSAGELDKANFILDKLKSRSFDARILDGQSVDNVVKTLMEKIGQIDKLSIQEQMNIMSFLVELSSVAAIDFTSLDKLEKPLKQLAESIINNSQTDFVTKMNVISKMREFYSSIGLESDNAYIQSLEALIKGADQKKYMIGRIDAQLDIISDYDENIDKSTRITQKAALKDRIFDIETASDISPDMQSILITALIRIYRNANLNEDEQNQLADNLMALYQSVNSLENLTGQEKMVLLNYAANLVNLTFSENLKPELQDNRISITQFNDLMNAIINLAGNYGDVFVEVLQYKGIELGKNLPNLAVRLANGTIRIDIRALTNGQLLQTVLLRQVLAQRFQLTDSLTDKLILDTLVLDFINKEFDTNTVAEINNFILSDILASLSQLSDFTILKEQFDLANDRQQQLAILIDYLVKQSYREKGFTDLEISKIKDEIARKANKILSFVISRVKNIDTHKGSSIEFKGANALIVKRTTDSDIEVRLSDDLRGRISKSDIFYASYEASSNQVRILTKDNRIFVVDASTGELVLEIKFNQVLDGTSMDILINRQITMAVTKDRANAKIVSGMASGRKISLVSRSLPILSVLKDLFAEEKADSPIIAALSDLESGNIDVVVVDTLPGKLADGNEFISAYKDIRTGKGTIFISKTAWEKLDPYALEARDPKVDALMAVLLKSALLINGYDISSLYDTADWRSQNNWLTLNEHYNALFFHELLLDEQMRQAIGSEVDKMNERIDAIEHERAQLAQKLLRKKEELRAKAKERTGEIPAMEFSLGGRTVQIEQWNIEEIDGRKFMFLSLGQDIGDQVLIDLNAITEMKFKNFVIRKVGDQIQISYSKGGQKQTANLLTDINANPRGVAITFTDSKGNIVTQVYDVHGELVHEITRIVSAESTRVPAGFSFDDAKAEIKKLEQLPEEQKRQDQIDLLKLQYINAVLAKYNSYIDKADGIDISGIYDDMVKKGVSAEQVVQNPAVKSIKLSTIIIDSVKYQIKDGKLEQFDFENINADALEDIPLSYIEGNTLIVFDSQGIRYEFALSNSEQGASTQFEAGQLISVLNMAEYRVLEQLGIDLDISQDYKDKYNEVIDRFDQEVKQLEDDIRRYERLQKEAFKTQDAATAQLTAQKYYIEILKKHIQIAHKNQERLQAQKDFLVKQTNIAATHYRKAVAENQPETVIAQYLAIQKAFSSQLQAINEQNQKLDERIRELQQTQSEAEKQKKEQGAKKFAEEGKPVHTNNSYINDEIKKHIDNNTLQEFLLQLAQDGNTYKLTLDSGEIISINKQEFRERLLDKDMYKHLVGFLKGFDLSSKQDVEKILNAVIRITFDRPGAASMTSEYELAVLSEVQARAKKARLQADVFARKAQEYLDDQDYVISSRGKERDTIQTKKLTEKNKKTILKRIYKINESIISKEDKAILKSEILKDTQKNRTNMIDELLAVEELEEGSAEYNKRLAELKKLSRDQLYRTYTLLKSLSLQDSDFGINYGKIRKSSSKIIAQILVLENLKEGDAGYNERLSELEALSKDSAKFQDIVIHYLALSYLKKNFITHSSKNFQEMLELLTKSEEGMQYLQKALLVEHILKMKVDQKVKTQIKKVEESEKKKLSDERKRRIRLDIENKDFEILTDRSQMLKKDIGTLQNFLREEFVRSGKYEDKLDEHLAEKSRDLQEKAKKYDFIEGNVPKEFILEAYSAVMLSLMAEKGFFYHDVQLYGATLLANGGVINVGTGEGKTLTSALSLYLHSLSGETAVQFLTQESFARSDASSVRGLLGRLGVDVSVVTKDTDRQTVKEAFMRKADREKAGLPTTPRVVYTPFSDFAFIKLEDLKYAKDSKILPEKLAYANFDEIDALLFEGSLMDFINADPSDSLKTEDVQVYRLIWDFVLKIRGDGAQLETVKDTDPEYSFLQNMMDGLKKVDDGSLFVLSKDKTSIQLKDQAKILIRELYKKAQEQGYDLPDLDKFEEIVRITLEQHFFHKEKVNWTFEPKKDENGEIVRDENNEIVYEVKLINTQGEHTTQRQSNHRHTIIEVWAKYYLGKNIEILGDSETTGKIGGADVIKSFLKFSGFSGSIATEVAREELKKLYGKDSIAEIPSSIQKVIERRETGVFTTKEERNEYLLAQIEDILKNRDGAPVLAATKDYQEAEILYDMYMDRLEIMAEEDLRKAIDILPEKLRSKLQEKIKQFRSAKAIRAEGDDPSVLVKSEISQEIKGELQKHMLASYLNKLNTKKIRLEQIIIEINAEIEKETNPDIKAQLEKQRNK